MFINKKMRETAAGRLIQEMLSLNSQRGIPSKNEEAPIPQMSGAQFAQLLEANFKRIDINGDGISRKELAFALGAPQMFSPEEYTMLRLVGKYFNSIASMCDDQADGEAVRITPTDKDVLVQFLAHSNMSMQDIHDWLTLNERSVAPPPMSSASD